MICPICNGCGEVYTGGWGILEGPPEIDECRLCDSTGSIGDPPADDADIDCDIL